MSAEERRGVCHFVTKKSSCTQPADFHILVDDESCSAACTDHVAIALKTLQPIDHHPQGELCTLSTDEEPRLRWHLSTPEHAGFCYLDEGDILEQLDITIHVPLDHQLAPA